MSDEAFINILVAEDNDVSREMMVGILKTRGFNILQARDGDSAIEVVKVHNVDLALVDINMAPKGGFEFVKYLVSKGMDIPVVIITGDDSSDILIEANALGVARVFQKPVEPERLLQTVERTLKRRGLNPNPMGVETHRVHFTPEELMDKAIALAAHNVQSGNGGPFGAILSDAQGKVIGEGVNGRASRIDPTGHSEVMAIRQGAEKLGQTSLHGCVLYCSSQPTKIGQALIESVGIERVYFGITHEDIGLMREHNKTAAPVYEQMHKDKVLAIFQSWKPTPSSH